MWSASASSRSLTMTAWRIMAGSSAHAEAERVASRVEEDAERRARLVVGLGGPEIEDGRLPLVEVADHHVEVHLLRRLLPRPLRRPVALHRLERDAVAAVLRPDLAPPLVGGDLPAQQLAVEGGERPGVRAVHDERGVAGDGHGRSVD